MARKASVKKPAAKIQEVLPAQLPVTSKRSELVEKYRKDGIDARLEDGIIIFRGGISLSEAEAMLNKGGYNASFGIKN